MDNVLLRGSRGSIILRLSAVLFPKCPHKMCSIEMLVLLSPVQLTGTFPNSGMSSAFVMHSPGKLYQTSNHPPAHPIRPRNAVMTGRQRKGQLGNAPQASTDQHSRHFQRNAIECQRKYLKVLHFRFHSATPHKVIGYDTIQEKEILNKYSNEADQMNPHK